MILQGQVLFGINNIYTVLSAEKEYECRIKGKILRGRDIVYNPLAAGDFVLFEIESPSLSYGMITEKLPRKSEYARWNKKRNAPQIIAANFDILVVVASVKKPPFRPRFIDRILVMADSPSESLLVLNKTDQGISGQLERRMEDYKRIGYKCMHSSAKSGEGINPLKKLIKGKVAVFAGQSGVGKSTLLNTMFPSLHLRIGEISEKYNRGRHTTNYARLIPLGDYEIIDTPGIREIEVFDIIPSELAFRFPEFIPFIGKCFYPSCLHRDEPECSIREAVKRGDIHEDRYSSYRRILKDIMEKNPY